MDDKKVRRSERVSKEDPYGNVDPRTIVTAKNTPQRKIIVMKKKKHLQTPGVDNMNPQQTYTPSLLSDA